MQIVAVPHTPPSHMSREMRTQAVDGALVTTTRRQALPKSNSQRGKEFRARRKRREAELEASVSLLRAQVEELTVARSIFDGRQLLTARFCDSGALVRLSREYFSLFRHGLRDVASLQVSAGHKRDRLPGYDSVVARVEHQELFLHQVMDADCVVGDYRGPEASIEQWRRYTSAHDGVRAEVEYVKGGGTEDHPVVELQSKMHARISRNTFRLMFPGALAREDLVQKFLGRQVVYTCVHHFEFTPQGRISYEGVEFDFLQGLLDSGFSLHDAAELLQASVVTAHCLIPDPSELLSSSSTPTSPLTKLSVAFLLTDEPAEDAAGESSEEGPRVEMLSAL